MEEWTQVAENPWNCARRDKLYILCFNAVDVMVKPCWNAQLRRRFPPFHRASWVV